MIQAIKSYLPSRNTSIFLGSIASLVGLKQYDNYEVKKQLKAFNSKVKQLADKPMGTDEMPSKLIVFLHSPESSAEASYKSTEYFIKYIKPIWDASAVDYEVVTEKKGGEIQKYILDKMKNLRQGLPLIKPSFENSSENPFITEINSPILGWVALGRESFGKVLLGIQDGASLSELSFDPDFKEIEFESGVKESKISETETKELPCDQLVSLIPPGLNSGSLELPLNIPALGYIRFHHYYGFRYIPLRIYKWFSDRNYVKEVGQDALDIVLSQPKEMNIPKDFVYKSYLDNRPIDFEVSKSNVFNPSLSSRLSLLYPEI